MLYFEDLTEETVHRSESMLVNAAEIVSFAKRWDPLPFHVDEALGIAAFGSLTAPGVFVLACKQRLVHTLPPLAVIASTGYEEVKFRAPMRPGEVVTLTMNVLSRKVSTTKPDRGVVRLGFSLFNQDGAPIMTMVDVVLMRLRHGT